MHPDQFYIPFEKLTSWHFYDQYPSKLQPLITAIWELPGFFLGLEPVPGSLSAIHEIAWVFDEIFICSTPLAGNWHCPSEKVEWIETHLGREWAERLILTHDKTLVRGDILIDDKPSVLIKGAMQPVWQHVLFDRPYNQGALTTRRLRGWQNWREVLL